MGKEIITKKSEYIHYLLQELVKWTAVDFEKFNNENDTTLVRASERNLEMLVELASDINAAIALDKMGRTPDAYKDSFQLLNRLGLINKQLCDKLVDSVKLRNGLVHEYDFELDNRKFYDSLKNDFIPGYTEYLKAIANFLK